ncbi:hypothetical protein RHGRI_038949 [Rhododendron griersonianum]|uniref:Uncharacterized protein n=1 Tax=Rhododendron griersonianum TaxID=479676 RepID=A0AAV6HHW0_9ERIC|nr:hypothetical protein RHGRI_038949 [Rhododendron griersonianum]
MPINFRTRSLQANQEESRSGYSPTPEGIAEESTYCNRGRSHHRSSEAPQRIKYRTKLNTLRENMQKGAQQLTDAFLKIPEIM